METADCERGQEASGWLGGRGVGGEIAADTERGINSEEIMGARATRMSRSRLEDEARTEVRTEMKRKGGRKEIARQTLHLKYRTQG